MEAAGYDLEIVGTEVGLEELDRRVLEDEIEAYVALDDLTVQEGTFAYRSKDSPGRVRGALLESIVVETVLELRLSVTESGAGVRELLDGGRMNFERLGGEAQSEAEEITGIATGFAGALILYMSMLLYGVVRPALGSGREAQPGGGGGDLRGDPGAPHAGEDPRGRLDGDDPARDLGGVRGADRTVGCPHARGEPAPGGS